MHQLLGERDARSVDVRHTQRGRHDTRNLVTLMTSAVSSRVHTGAKTGGWRRRHRCLHGSRNQPNMWARGTARFGTIARRRAAGSPAELAQPQNRTKCGSKQPRIPALRLRSRPREPIKPVALYRRFDRKSVCPASARGFAALMSVGQACARRVAKRRAVRHVFDRSRGVTKHVDRDSGCAEVLLRTCVALASTSRQSVEH